MTAANIASHGKRTESRFAAIKALYAADINHKIEENKTPAELTLDIISYYHDNDEGLKNVKLDEEFLAKIVLGVCENISVLNQKIANNLTDGWSMERRGSVLRAILRAGVYELMVFSDTPLKVILNEYVNITREYFDEKEVGFVNGILDKIAHEVRENEV